MLTESTTTAAAAANFHPSWNGTPPDLAKQLSSPAQPMGNRFANIWTAKTLNANLTERGTHAQLFPVQLDAFAGAAPAIADLAARASFYEQALRALVLPAGGGEAQTWWAIAATEVSITLARTDNDQDATGTAQETLQLSYAQHEAAHYQPAQGTYELSLDCPDAVSLSLDYDYLLADQTHRNQHPIDFKDYTRSVQLKQKQAVVWKDWLVGNARPKRLASPTTTANIAFEKHYAELVRSIEAFHARIDSSMAGQWTPHLTYSQSGPHYKFIEHAVQRARAHDIPPSHVERLTAYEFTWGNTRSTPAELFLQAPGSIYSNEEHVGK